MPESKKWLEIQEKTTKTSSTYERIKNGVKDNLEQFRMIYRSPSVLRICFVLMPLWIAGPTSWMVINFAVGQLFGNIFVNVVVLGLADLLANILLVLTVGYFRRQVLTSICYGGMSLCFLVSFGLRLYPSELIDKINVGFMMMAKFCASGKLLLPRFSGEISSRGKF